MANTRKKTKKKNNDKAFIRIIIALTLFVLTLSVIILKESMGVVGQYTSQAIFIGFGLTAYILPFYALFLFFAIVNKTFWQTYRKDILILSLLFVNLVVFTATFYAQGSDFKSIIENSFNQALSYTGVGIIFTSIYYVIHMLIADIGIYILTCLAFFISYFYIFDKSIGSFFTSIFTSIKDFITSLFDKNKQRKIEKNKSIKRNDLLDTPSRPRKIKKQKVEEFSENEYGMPHISYHNSEKNDKDHLQGDDLEQEINDNGQVAIKYDEPYEYTKPPIDLLNHSKAMASDDKTRLLDNAEIITDTLESFGIDSEVVNINSGPTVTSYEVKPQSGIKVQKIVNLSNNLAMALSSPSIRIEAPIPGKPYVGIEVPNQNKDIVTFRSLISTDEFLKNDNDITVAIGKDIFGKPLYAKINDMPHLLIAGATGSGKSVLMNAIIMSIIYKYSPEEVEFIMVDPKMVELKIYSGIPHLKGRKVVTKAQEATASLHEAVKEMTSRFELFSQTGARDIGAYNTKVEEDDEDGKLKKLSYLVVIIDELSDLMMEASKDVEHYITRLAQMGRASGVHLIIATQRPSVNVITGIIKANIPSRIAFQVTSNVDSRTILDSQGAEKLLGKGDMLYYPSTLPKPKRAQGAFVTDHEVERVVAFVKEQNLVEKTNESFNKKIEEVNKPQDILEEVDELFDDAVRFVLTEESASISAVQRRFRVGYARAGRIIDQMTQRGIVSEQDGSKPRNILISLEDYEEGNQELDNDEDEFS